jgi:hypothetical protein
MEILGIALVIVLVLFALALIWLMYAIWAILKFVHNLK